MERGNIPRLNFLVLVEEIIHRCFPASLKPSIISRIKDFNSLSFDLRINMQLCKC